MSNSCPAASMHSSTASPSLSPMRRRFSLARADCASNSSRASYSSAPGVKLPIPKMLTRLSGTRCRNSARERVRIRTPSHSGTSVAGSSYVYFTQSPYGPTMSAISSQYRTTESTPHHTSCSGGREDFVPNSGRILEKLVDMTSKRPSRVKQASSCPLGATAMRTIVPCTRLRVVTLSASTTRMAPSTASSTSSRPDIVNCGSITVMHSGGLSCSMSGSDRHCTRGSRKLVTA
mmetsp:Transcript_3577/g.7423  ORF Transcript_3577/g.7423 Transcript_3577/m.7423 type:complete len:233 (-) Transcript_3577:728-1426(-)